MTDPLAAPITDNAVAPTESPITAPVETNWMSGFDDDSTGFIQNKGWKEPSDVLGAYRELESFRGVPADQLIKMPKDYTDPEAWGEIYNKLGRPEDAAGYQFNNYEAPEGIIDGTDDFRALAHKHGLSQNQAAGIHQEWNDMMAAQFNEMNDAQSQEIESQSQVDMQNLQKEWGNDYEKNIAIGQQAVQRFDIDQEILGGIESAIGTKATMELMAKLGAGIGEAGFVNGQSSGAGVMTKEMAGAKLMELRGNEDFSRRLLKGDQAANAEIDKLIKIKVGQ